VQVEKSRRQCRRAEEALARNLQADQQEERRSAKVVVVADRKAVVGRKHIQRIQKLGGSPFDWRGRSGVDSIPQREVSCIPRALLILILEFGYFRFGLAEQALESLLPSFRQRVSASVDIQMR